MDPIDSLGKRLSGRNYEGDGDEQRDAIHIAIMPVVLDDKRMRPGDVVQFVPGSTELVRGVVRYDSKGVGVIDPFLSEHSILEKGDRVWMMLNPNSITGLRHDWTCDAVDNQKELSESELWLQDFADRWGFDHKELISVAIKPDVEWACITSLGRDIHSAGELGEDHDLFWHHLEIVEKRKFNEEHRNKVGWSCSC